MKHQPFQWFAETYEDWMKDTGLTLMTSKMMEDGSKTYKATVDAYFENRVLFTEYHDLRHGGWAFVHPSTHTPGEWRYTMFDNCGFLGHEDNFITEFDAYYEMHDRHYKIIDRGALERMMKGKDWPKGGMIPKPSWMGAFEPYPEQFFGGQAGGTHKLPGFHTATDIETTYPYAQQKVDVPDDIESLEEGLTDYPVIIELDMEGLTPLPDFDAIETKGTIETVLSEIHEEMNGNAWRKPQSPFEALYSLCEGSGEGYEEYIPDSKENGSSAEALFYLTALTPAAVAYGMRDILETYSDPNATICLWLERGIPDSALIDIQGQKRYTVLIPSDRILAVYYMTPYIHSVLPMYWDDEGEAVKEVEEYAKKAESLGYEVIADDDLYNFSSPTLPVEVWRRRTVKNPEFHGTSYCNLARAVPELMRHLPIPPPPFIHHGSCRR